MLKGMVRFAAVLALMVAAPSISFAALCPDLTDDVWLNSCDIGAQDASCARTVPNQQVLSLQRFLTELYVPSTNIMIGIFGPRTKALVEQFQREHGVISTGQVRTLTRAAIASVCSSGAPDPTQARPDASTNSYAQSTYIGAIQSSNTYAQGLYTTITMQESTTSTSSPQAQAVPSGPRCSIRATPAYISYGESTLLSWESTGTVGGTITSIGAVEPSGQKRVTPLQSTTYTAVLWPDGEHPQSARCDASVGVSGQGPGPCGEAPTGCIWSGVGNSCANYTLLCPSQTSCLWNGRSLREGESVSAFRPNASGACDSEIRTCKSGTLTGSYPMSSCGASESGLKDKIISPRTGSFFTGNSVQVQVSCSNNGVMYEVKDIGSGGPSAKKECVNNTFTVTLQYGSGNSTRIINLYKQLEGWYGIALDSVQISNATNY